MDNSILVSVICPATMFLSVVGTVIVLRLLGILWPWEQQQLQLQQQQQRKNNRLAVPDRKWVRCKAVEAPKRMERELQRGWMLANTEDDGGPGILIIHFLRVIDD